ncbi:uncharacterized protein [Procambarus clarkii]|uniref:uncharacterized protein n=1 Tax=Procambarus clarkii TaxID=6728 RepID=UPI003743CD8A
MDRNYADDFVIIIKGKDAARLKPKCISKEAKQIGIKLNPTKTKAMPIKIAKRNIQFTANNKESSLLSSSSPDGPGTLERAGGLTDTSMTISYAAIVAVSFNSLEMSCHGLVLLSLVMDPRRPSRLTVPWVEEDQTLQAATQVAAHRQNPHYPHHTGRLNDAPGTTAGPEVDLGESASVFKMDHDSRTTACPSDVKVEEDDSSDDDCLVIDLDESTAWMTTTAGHEVALGEAASRRTILPHSGETTPRSPLARRPRGGPYSPALGSVLCGWLRVGSTREVRLPRDSTSNIGVALGEAASRRTILPHPGVSLGRLAPGGVDEDEGVNAVKQAQDTPDDDDCTEVALGEAASRRTTLPHPGVSLGRLAPGGVDSRDDGKEAGATRPAHDATRRPKVALGEAASRGTPVGTTFGRTNPGASNVELVPDVTTITNDASPEDDPGIWTSWTTPSRTPFYSFTSGVGFSDLITSAPGIGSSDLASKPRLASALQLRYSSTPADLGVGTSDASHGVGSSDTSPRTGSTNKHLRAGACNTPLRAGPGSAKTSTTRADPSDDSQTATVPETGSGVGASGTRPGTDSTSKPCRAGACNAPLRASSGNAKTSTTRADPSDDSQTAIVQGTVLGVGTSDTSPGTEATNKPLRAGACYTPLRAGPGNAKTSTTRADPQTATVQGAVSGAGASDDRDFWDSPLSQRPQNRQYTFRRVHNESDDSNDSQDAQTMSQEINGLLNQERIVFFTCNLNTIKTTQNTEQNKRKQ